MNRVNQNGTYRWKFAEEIISGFVMMLVGFACGFVTGRFLLPDSFKPSASIESKADIQRLTQPRRLATWLEELLWASEMAERLAASEHTAAILLTQNQKALREQAALAAQRPGSPIADGEYANVVSQTTENLAALNQRTLELEETARVLRQHCESVRSLCRKHQKP